MIERRVVRRYATALFNASSSMNVVDRVESDLGLISYALEVSKPLADALKSPLLPAAKKRDIIKDVFSDKVHELTLSYLFLLVDKRRDDAILQTEQEYLMLANKARGIVNAEVTTAVKMTQEQEALLIAKLTKVTGKQVHLVKNIDSSIIAGVLVRIGDRVIDGSIKGQLAELKDSLLD